MTIWLVSMILLNNVLSQNIGESSVVWQEKPAIALTFDDGPMLSTTPKLLDILRANNVRATFFVVGEMAQTCPEIIKRIYAEGHEIGNHTYHHKNILKLSKNDLDHQINSCQETIFRACGYRSTIFRSPGGNTNQQLDDFIKINYGLNSLLWDIDPNDWRYRNSSRTAKFVLDHAKPNKIVLLHDIHLETVKAVPEIIKGLRDAGYRFVTCSQLKTAN